jgi:hypothetical protein
MPGGGRPQVQQRELPGAGGTGIATADERAACETVRLPSEQRRQADFACVARQVRTVTSDH